MKYFARFSALLWLVLFLGLFPILFVDLGWPQTTPIEGLRQNTPDVHALVNARIVPAPGKVIEKGSVILRDGIIEAVGEQLTPPPDARIWNYEGLTIYPGLIESYSHLGLPKEKKKEPQGSAAQASQPKKQEKQGAEHWNPRVHPENNAARLYRPGKEEIEKLRALGFTAALIVPDKGIFRGTSALVSLVDGSPNEQIIRENVAQHLAFERSRSFRDRTYPNSLMGAIALIRQTLLDAQWYRQAYEAYNLKPQGQTKPEANEALAALSEVLQGVQPVIFEVENDLNLLRALKIGREFGLKLWIRGSGHEYRQIEKIKTSDLPLIVPVNFPEAPDVESAEAALSVSLVELSHWDAAPENPKRLQRAGIQFALTSAALKKPTDFHQRVRQAIGRGLTKEAALAALTSTPAKLLGADKQLGSIEPGKLAHLVVTEGELFDEESKILDVWVNGKRFEVTKKPEVDPRGHWQLTFTLPDEKPLQTELELKGKVEKLSGTLLKDTTKIKLQKANLVHKRLSLVFTGDSLGHAGVIRMSGSVEEKKMTGQGQLPDGWWFNWSAEWKEAMESEEIRPGEKSKIAAEPAKAPLSPPGAYGRLTAPVQPEHVLIRGTTIWTCGPQGRLENADMLVTKGKITAIGRNLDAPSDAFIIDANGKHVTPGLIDAHSHTGISQGVNEGTQAVTAEVRVGDVINNYDIAFYRELAGGLTVAHQLHGSANPIGGHTSVVKLRWGASPEELKIEDAMPGIKFALGENVKQSNWGDRFTTRYPQTRMGVEQIIRDRFKAALDYEKEWKKYDSLKNKKGMIPPRRDLELEALLEVLHGKRLVHSHSYRQDEILMLVRIAEDFGFTIGAFQHVLEGYKVAEALAQHGAGASTFSDWWAYKFEVYDAIPYNGALMHDAGVVVSFNSDSGELARRLNLEAAKAVKYGGLSQEEALRFVTLNPAKQLRIDHRVGSLEPGKDADFVIWSGHPLSTYTICEQTWIDGRKYFDRKQDLEMRKQVVAERARLIQKVLAAKANEKMKSSKSKEKPSN
ncbi:MAG: amidohydrolase family protein [bacterium]